MGMGVKKATQSPIPISHPGPVQLSKASFSTFVGPGRHIVFLDNDLLSISNVEGEAHFIKNVEGEAQKVLPLKQ